MIKKGLVHFSLITALLLFQNCSGDFTAVSELSSKETSAHETSSPAHDQPEAAPSLSEPSVEKQPEEEQSNDSAEAEEAPSENEEFILADSFSCLNNNKYTYINSSLKGKVLTGSRKIKDDANTVLDLRNTTINVHDPKYDEIVNGEAKVDSRYGLIQTGYVKNYCTVGGAFFNPNPWDVSWEEAYDTLGFGKGLRLGTNRNNSIIDITGENPTVTGAHWLNMHDGPRFNSATGFWRLQHSWGEYTRDDCIENDKIKSGIIYDTLFDGCFTGYSNRASATDDESNGQGQLVEFNKVLLRMELMPGPQKQCEKTSHYFGSDKKPFDEKEHGDCKINKNIYGSGNMFKLDDVDRNPNFSFVDSVFVMPVKHTSSSKADFPAAKNIIKCENVTIVYLGEGSYPGVLPTDKFPECFTVLTGTEGRAFWAQKVADWHKRHPLVGETRKPSVPGEMPFPKGQLKR